MSQELAENTETGNGFETPGENKILDLPNTPVAPRKTKKPPEKYVIKPTIRRRSLTMTDIRYRTPGPCQSSTPIKRLKKDSCSTTNTSPNNKVASAKKMLAIRRRELQIRAFSRFFYHLWRKQRSVAKDCKSELKQLNLQKLFLMNLRDKESERREEITKVADQQKKEILDLTDVLTLITKEHENIQEFCEVLQREYVNCIKYIEENITKYSTIEEQNQQVLTKVKEVNDIMDIGFVDLKRIIRWVQEYNIKYQQKNAHFNILKRENEIFSKNAELNKKTINILQEKLRIKEENEKNLKNSIRELENNLENSTSNNLDLKCEVKNIQLQLEYAEHLIEEQKFHSISWGNFIRKATTISMYLLFKLGFIPVY